MKRAIFITCLAIFFVNVSSQNFECIKTDAVYYFTDVDMSYTGEQQYKAIRIDSTAISGDTTTYFQFPVIGIENWQWDCYSGNWPSWIGRKIDIKTDGTTIFYNLENGPITIKPQLEVGEEWVCFDFYTGGYYKASVESLSQMTFLEMTDWVKKITFQAYGCEGEPVIHPINNKYILVSQNHGLVRALNFKVFPDLIDNFWGDECHEYELCGISEPENGIQNLTIDRIFDFEIGDEFHISEESWVYFTYEGFNYIKIVLDKLVANNEITYTFSRCGRKEYHDVNPVIDTLWSIQDTIEESIDISSPLYNVFEALPDQYIKIGDTNFYEYSWTTQQLNPQFFRIEKTLYEGFYSDYPHDCIYQIITSKSPFWPENFYDGLGGPFWEQYTYWSSSRKIIYYKKGEEQWGSPYNCDSLLVSQPEIRLAKASISIAPNPMRDFTKISINLADRHSTKMILYNVMGKIVREEMTNELTLRKGEIQSGIYLIRVFESDKLLGTKKLIVE